MFWDTTDLWLDDDQTRKVKSLRRKSNYYESKYDDLDSYLSKINKLLSSAENTYGLWKKTISCPSQDVLQFAYYESKNAVYSDADNLITSLEGKRDVVNRQRDRAYELYRYL